MRRWCRCSPSTSPAVSGRPPRGSSPAAGWACRRARTGLDRLRGGAVRDLRRDRVRAALPFAPDVALPVPLWTIFYSRRCSWWRCTRASTGRRRPAPAASRRRADPRLRMAAASGARFYGITWLLGGLALREMALAFGADVPLSAMPYLGGASALGRSWRCWSCSPRRGSASARAPSTRCCSLTWTRHGAGRGGAEPAPHHGRRGGAAGGVTACGGSRAPLVDPEPDRQGVNGTSRRAG